jgi:hypothetical protein
MFVGCGTNYIITVSSNRIMEHNLYCMSGVLSIEFKENYLRLCCPFHTKLKGEIGSNGQARS